MERPSGNGIGILSVIGLAFFIVGFVISRLLLTDGPWLSVLHGLILAVIGVAIVYVAFWILWPPHAGEMAVAHAAPAPEPVHAPTPAPVAEVMPEPEPEPAPAPAAAPEPEPAPATAPAASAGGQPAGIAAPEGGTGDDLKKIKGVGPKLEKQLNGLGVWHFAQIAAWGTGDVAWMDENLEGFKGRVSRDGWVEQAKLLASGGATEFSKRVDKGDVY